MAHRDPQIASVGHVQQTKGIKGGSAITAALVILCSLVIVGCATPYGDEGITGGISEADLGKGKIEIKVVGNDWTSYESMENMWRKRAASVAAMRGNGRFETLNFSVGREAYGLNIIGGAKVARGIIQLCP